MRFFIAGLDTETNTFSPIPTGLESFAETLIAHGDATARPLNWCSSQLSVWRHLGEARGWTVIESLCAVAEPGGPTSRGVYEGFREEIENDLRTAGAIDFALFAFHGAMVADGYDDVEGDVLARVRALLGPQTPIGVELDLHCHLTQRMIDESTAIVLYKEYPHTDIEERARELFQIIVDAVDGHTCPVMASFDCRMLGNFRPQEEPLRSFVTRMKSFEGREGILSVSFGHGFAWGDVAEVGAKTLVVADGSKSKAQTLAVLLGREIYSMRHQLLTQPLSIDEALDEGLRCEKGPVILADTSDNAGGGAASDATFVLKRILERGIGNVASALHWDPIAVRFCREAGEGATFNLRIGGKTGLASGTPLDLRVTVRKLASHLTQPFGSSSLPIGDAACVHANGVDLILNTQRTQVLHPQCFTALGLDPTDYRFVVVKSSNHFYASFAPLASRILFIDGPGALQRNYSEIRYTKLSRAMWPIVDDPLVNRSGFPGGPIT
jgi:microcystin degradation protein MlrC